MKKFILLLVTTTSLLMFVDVFFANSVLKSGVVTKITSDFIYVLSDNEIYRIKNNNYISTLLAPKAKLTFKAKKGKIFNTNLRL